MSDLDDRIRRGLEGLAAPAEPTDVFTGIERRKRRRSVVRRVQRGVLVVAVIAGSAGGAFALNRAFQGAGERPARQPEDSQLIAFVRRTVQGNRIFVMHPDGSGVHQLIDDNAEQPDEFDPAWSPDGEWLAFSDAHGDLYKVRPDGSQLTRLSTDPADETAVSEHQPSWAPDNQRIVAAVDPLDGQERPRLATVGVDGSDWQMLETGPGNAYEPAWSPNGRTIAFVSDRSGNPDIYIFDLHTGRSRPFVRNPGIGDHSPAWSPDGNMIAYISGPALFLADNGGITHAAVTPGDRYYSGPSWSSDGEQLVVAGLDPEQGGGYDIFRLLADPDAEAERITTDPAHEGSPAWQPLPTAQPVPGPTPSASPSPSAPPCGNQTGRVLYGDIDGDGSEDRVTTGIDYLGNCNPHYAKIAWNDSGNYQARIEIRGPDWPSPPDPELLMLAQIDGQPGLEIVVDLSPVAVYRTAAVYTGRDRVLALLEVNLPWTAPPATVFPFADETPIGIDCADDGIVLTLADYSFEQYDSGTDPLRFTRTFFSFSRHSGIRGTFVVNRVENVTIPRDQVDRNGGQSYYPELGGTPFLSCSGRVE